MIFLAQRMVQLHQILRAADVVIRAQRHLPRRIGAQASKVRVVDRLRKRTPRARNLVARIVRKERHESLLTLCGGRRVLQSVMEVGLQAARTTATTSQVHTTPKMLESCR